MTVLQPPDLIVPGINAIQNKKLKNDASDEDDGWVSDEDEGDEMASDLKTRRKSVSLRYNLIPHCLLLQLLSPLPSTYISS